MLRDRFDAPLDPRARALSGSTREDAVLLPYDLWGSVAHARGLAAAGLIEPRSARRIEAGLRRLGDRAARGRFRLDPALEDVHLNVEASLTDAIGPDGERLHTGRSRNDQVAVDLALYERDALRGLEADAARVASALLAVARGPDGAKVVAGWTHLQPAQSVYWAQLLGTHALRFVRDAERFARIRGRITESPLGSGALAGSSLPLDRVRTARMLGFRRPSSSSVDSVSDRDPLAETVFAATMALVHAGALAEELVIGSMEGVGRVRLADAFVTTSSLMPHKRNPDLAELLRAETGPAMGRLTAVLGVLKGLPLGYQRDLQATKPILIESVERTRAALGVLEGMVATASFRSESPDRPAVTASVELADALVRAGVPFRSAHGRVARYVAEREAEGLGLPDGDAPTFRAAFPELDGRGFVFPTRAEEPERRTTIGGSSRRSVARLLGEVARRIAVSRRRTAGDERTVRRHRKALGIPEGWGFVGAGTAPTPKGPRSPRARRG